MLWNFPPGREEKRQVLLDAVAEVREVLEAGADQSEEEGTLPQDSVDALYESGLLGLKLPAELGGAEADPVTQLEVIEALARIDASAAWCTMIGATSMGSWGAFCPTGRSSSCSWWPPAQGSGSLPACRDSRAQRRRVYRQWPVALCQRDTPFGVCVRGSQGRPRWCGDRGAFADGFPNL